MSLSTGEAVIFINYRRSESLAVAQRLEAALQECFSDHAVFRDESTPGGEKYPAHLEARVRQSKVLVSLICPNWHRIQDKVTGKRRIDSDKDWVRRELELARKAGVTILPLLLDEAEQPVPDWDLPASLQFLCELQSKELREASFADDVADLCERIKEVLDGVLQPYREQLVRQHKKLIRFFPEAQEQLLEKVYVELAIDHSLRHDRERARHDAGLRFDRQTHLSLRELLELPVDGEHNTGRWVVLGDPGAGKTTIARYLTHQLAAEGAMAPAVPVFVSLPQWSQSDEDVFDFTERWVGKRAGKKKSHDLADTLRRLAGQPGRLWILLDGLDEVAGEHVEELRDRIDALSSEVPHARIAVLGRKAGYEGRRLDFPKATLQDLDPTARKQLLGKWIGEEQATRVLEGLERRPFLVRLLSNPLALTLVASLVLDAPDDEPEAVVPHSRVKLYDKVITVLLKRGHARDGGRGQGGVGNPRAARRILQELALALQTSETMTWDFEHLDEQLWQIREKVPEVENLLKGTHWNGDHDAFLREVAEKSGILADHDGEDAPWSLLHRQFREFLSAEALAGREEAARTEFLDTLSELEEGEDEDIDRSAEVLALTASLAPDPAGMLELWSGHLDEDVLLRALPEIERLEPDQALALLRGTSWEGHDLELLARGWVDLGALEADGVLETLWPLVTAEQSLERLGQIHHAMVCAGAKPNRERFFEACGRPVQPDANVPEFVDIPAGSFLMGSPEDEPGRFEREGPQRPMHVEAFRLARTAVTNAQYRQFDSGHEMESFEGRVSDAKLPMHPVVNVSWWHAYLYCAWIDATLPSEAQWEYACRAGTQTSRYGELEEIGWYGDNSEDSSQPVAQKSSNAWELFDMIGNVEEWCADSWHDDYEGAPPHASAWAEPGASSRVARGGSWFSNAWGCRAAYRDWDSAGLRFYWLGFRPSRSYP